MSFNATAVDATQTGVLRRIADFLELTKPRVVFMVLITAFVGSPRLRRGPQLSETSQMLIGTALAAEPACAQSFPDATPLL
jgi:heme O synthase-like polyprenyltransferase